jgi:hypothetical protein
MIWMTVQIVNKRKEQKNKLINFLLVKKNIAEMKYLAVME